MVLYVAKMRILQSRSLGLTNNNARLCFQFIGDFFESYLMLN